MRVRCVADFLLGDEQATESEKSTSRQLEHDRRRFFAPDGGGDARIDAPERPVDFVTHPSFFSASESESESQPLPANSLTLALHAFRKGGPCSGYATLFSFLRKLFSSPAHMPILFSTWRLRGTLYTSPNSVGKSTATKSSSPRFSL